MNTYTRRDLEKKCAEASTVLNKRVEIVQEPYSKRYAVTYDLPERLRNNLDEWLRERDCNTIRYWIEHLDAEMRRTIARLTPEPLPLDPEHLRPVFNPHKATQRFTSAHAEPLTLQLQFTGTEQEIHRNRQRIAGQLDFMENER